MIRIRPGEERGHADHGWLSTYHTFSFAGYHDPQHMGFRTLRVLNDDTVQPGRGFGTHGHADMEIISYVVDGALEHRDSTGTGSVLHAGDVQRMSAGHGVTHSEFNHSQTETVRFLQIWILPTTKGIVPSYEERHFSKEQKRGRLQLIASPDGGEESLHVHQDVHLYASILGSGEVVQHDLAPGRHAWLQVVRGRLVLNGQQLGPGDGAAFSEEPRLNVEGVEMVEFLLFDLN
jgi:redox-sensitive bicupin YhaK (pirin superfamily)